MTQNVTAIGIVNKIALDVAVVAMLFVFLSLHYYLLINIILQDYLSKDVCRQCERYRHSCAYPNANKTPVLHRVAMKKLSDVYRLALLVFAQTDLQKCMAIQVVAECVYAGQCDGALKGCVFRVVMMYPRAWLLMHVRANYFFVRMPAEVEKSRP